MKVVWEIKDVLNAIEALTDKFDLQGAEMAKTFAEVLADVQGVKDKVVENTDQTVELFGQAGVIIEGQSALIAGLKAALEDLSKRVATEAEQAEFETKKAEFAVLDEKIDAAKVAFAAKLTANPV